MSSRLWNFSEVYSTFGFLFVWGRERGRGLTDCVRWIVHMKVCERGGLVLLKGMNTKVEGGGLTLFE